MPSLEDQIYDVWIKLRDARAFDNLAAVVVLEAQLKRLVDRLPSTT